MRVLFLCPHGAAKSVVAAAMFLDRATRLGRTDIEVRNAGTGPDDEVNPIAVQLLQRLGLPNPGRPQLVTGEDIDWADVVVSLGCPRESLPREPRHWEHWSDAPGVTEDEQGLVDLVEARVATLLTIPGQSISP
jgi:protein-tyrosine-phosphatase